MLASQFDIVNAKMENKMHAKYTASHTGIPLQMQQAFVEAANDA